MINVWIHALMTSVLIGSGSALAVEVTPPKPPQVASINTAELNDWLDQNPDGLLIDISTSDEIKQRGGTIRRYQNINIARGWLETRLPEIAPEADRPIVVYCGQNLRSPFAVKDLTDMGYTNVKNYSEGFFKWRDQGHPVTIPDEMPKSFLYRKPIKVVDGVWSAIGQTAPPLYSNSGHNNNLTFIETDNSVVVINASANYLLARAFHEEIQKITDKPVSHVIFENGQTHATMGAKYWKEQGAELIAHIDAQTELEEKAEQHLAQTQQRYRDKAMGSEVVLADRTFEDRLILDVTGEVIELLHFGPAHSPGDISVWLPQKELVIAGDMAFHERLLAVFEETDTLGWLDSWAKFADLKAKHVIPGHGHPTDMSEITKYTHDYLVHLRTEVGKLLDEGAGLKDAYDIDQSAYRHLDTFKELARRNAGRVYVQMEFE